MNSLNKYGVAELMPFWSFSFDIFEEMLVMSQEKLMSELDRLRSAVVDQSSSVRWHHFLKPVHVQLADKGSQVGALEVEREDCEGQLVRVVDNKAVALVVPRNQAFRVDGYFLWAIHHVPKLGQELRHVVL